jgi:cation diffusion facilitator CzcD-associated flavoprotein CzcO
MSLEVRHVDVLVVGAGFAGIYALKKFRDDLDLEVVAIEAGDTAGGTWYWNRYPGARCDSDGHLYCYSFDEDLLQDWDVKGKFPTQPELLRYLNHVVDRFGLRKDIIFGTRVETCKYDESRALWRITTSDNRHFTANYFVPCVGTLSIAKYVPNIPGIESFRGQWCHTADWPEDLKYSGKRIGVIGTGSSGVQTIPVLAETAAHLYVFQRSAQYSLPARHETATPEFYRAVKSRYGEIWDAARKSAGGFPWEHNGRRALDDSAEKRERVYEALYAEGGLKFALASYRDISYDLEANKTVSEFVRKKIRERVKDAHLADKLTPDFPFLARRLILDTNYFETYNNDNVTLVDVKADPIVRITPAGIQTENDEFSLDLIVFATGFDAVTGPFKGIDIRGRSGLALTEAWANGPQTYLGVQIANFPNMFLVAGPGATVGNLPLTIETHVDWIADYIRFARENGINTVEASADSQREWSDHITGIAERSVMKYSDSWYNGSNIPGKARAFLFYLGHFGKYRQLLADTADQGYPGFFLDGQLIGPEEGSSVWQSTG